MTQLDKAILIAANPFRYYTIAPGRATKELGDVEFHREHLVRHGGVFWDIIPMGRRDIPWKYPEIHSGYFYVSKVQKVKYWIEIEYIKRWKELSLDEIERYAPEPRRSYLRHYPQLCTMYYAILIRDIHELKPERTLEDFMLASGNKRVERVQNYVIVVNPGWR
ncbi:MAG: hypothetical protein QXX08_10805 [Candidatus Bathyarchaeia archaeon]